MANAASKWQYTSPENGKDPGKQRSLHETKLSKSGPIGVFKWSKGELWNADLVAFITECLIKIVDVMNQTWIIWLFIRQTQNDQIVHDSSS